MSFLPSRLKSPTATPSLRNLLSSSVRFHLIFDESTFSAAATSTVDSPISAARQTQRRRPQNAEARVIEIPQELKVNRGSIKTLGWPLIPRKIHRFATGAREDRAHDVFVQRPRQ